MSRDCCVAIPLSAMGLSAVCDCDTIFWCHSCEQRWLWRVFTFAWSSLSLRQPFCASSKGSGESAHLHRLTLAFIIVQNLLCCLKWRFVCCSRQQQILWWVCTFAQAVTGQCNKYQDLLCWQQRLLWVCTFAQARLSLLYSIEIPCAGLNGEFCNVYVNSECCGESAPATTGLLCNHQCVVSMRQKMLTVRCNKNSSIKHLLVYQEKKPKVVIVFWKLFHGNMTAAALRHVDFTQFRQLH